jgi:PEGA domain
MRSARHPDTWILLSDGSRSRKGTDAPAIRSDELLSEFTCETPARSNAEAAVTANAGSTNLTIAPRHLPNFTLHEQTAIPSPAPVRLLAFARRELIESLTAQIRTLRARVTRVPKVPMWIARVRGLRPLPAKTALSFAGGTATGILIMWFATVQPPSTIVPSATPAMAPDPGPLATKPPASPLNTHSAQESVSARSTSQPPALISTVAASGRRNDVVDQHARPSRAKSTPAATRRNAASTSTAARKNTSPGYRGSLVLRSAPEGARVFVNGALVGSTPLILENLPVGSRAVRIEADGYQHWSTSTQVVANQETHLSATLARAVP